MVPALDSISDVGSYATGRAVSMSEQVRLLNMLSDSMQLLLEAAAESNVGLVEEQVRMQNSLCELIRATQCKVIDRASDSQTSAEQRGQCAGDLLRAVAAVRSQVQIATALLPRLRRSIRVMLKVLAADEGPYGPSRSQVGQLV